MAERFICGHCSEEVHQIQSGRWRHVVPQRSKHPIVPRQVGYGVSPIPAPPAPKKVRESKPGETYRCATCGDECFEKQAGRWAHFNPQVPRHRIYPQKMETEDVSGDWIPHDPVSLPETAAEPAAALFDGDRDLVNRHCEYVTTLLTLPVTLRAFLDEGRALGVGSPFVELMAKLVQEYRKQ